MHAMHRLSHFSVLDALHSMSYCTVMIKMLHHLLYISGGGARTVRAYNLCIPGYREKK